MFRAQRNGKSPSSGERIDFKFSNFQALQVPKVWDKLLVSIISVETGKTVARSNKALVRNGNCQWTESLSESIWISHDDSSKELEEHLLKFVVSMGSARSGILGEATINIVRYMNSRSSAPVSLPLKKCNYGTILQVKIQSQTPRTKLRAEEPQYSGSSADILDTDLNEMDTRSNGSVVSLSKSVKSPTSQGLGSISHPGKIRSMKETSHSPSGSNLDIDSAEDSIEKQRFFRRNHINGIEHNPNESSRNDSPRNNFLVEENPSVPNSKNSSFKSRITHDDLEQDYEQSPSAVLPRSSLTNAGSSKNLLEAAEDTIEELRNEAKMWERNSHKLTLDLEILKERFSDQSIRLADMEIELSAAETERDGMKKEVDQLKVLLQETVVKQKATIPFHSEAGSQLQRELENELKYQKESNVDLALQLKRNQESNIELVCVLQELEEDTEKQKAEIEDLLGVKSKFSELEKSFQSNLMENRSLQLQLQQLEESEKTLQANLQILEQALENKTNELENERRSNSQCRSDLESEYRRTLSFKEEKIVGLESRLSKCISERKESEAGRIKEIEVLKQRVAEIERECSEVTNENLELLSELKELKKEIEERIRTIEEGKKLLEDYSSEVQQLERLNTELEAQVSDLEKEKEELQENMEVALTESNITSKCLDNLRNDLMVLSSSVDSHVSANKLLERKASELEKAKHEVDLRLFEVEEENVQLLERLSAMEDQLSRVKNEHENTLLELEKSKSITSGLQNEVRKLQDVENLLVTAREECERVKTEKSQLQRSAKSLIEECDTLQKSYEEMTKEKSELYENCSRLEIELMGARDNLSISSKNVADLEDRCSSMLEEFMFKEKSLTLHVDKLSQENWKLKEKSELEESLLNQTYVEKMAEIENFQREVKQLKEEISGLHEEKEKIASEALQQVSSLSSEKSKLEVLLEEVRSRCESLESELHTIIKESEVKIQVLTTELASLKQSQEKLTVDRDRKSKLLAGYRSREERRKTSENDLELKLTVSEYERQQLIEESAKLKDQLQNASILRDEVLHLKQKLDKLKHEKENLEASLRLVSSNYEELKAEKMEFVEKMSRLELSMSEHEDCKRNRTVLEGKLRRLEGDLTAKESLSALDAEMKNELSRIKSGNLQYQLKIQELEGEKNECLKKVRALEENLKLLSTKQDQSKSSSKKGDPDTNTPDDKDYVARIEMLEAELDEALDANNKYRMQLQRIKSDERNNHSSRKPKTESEVITKEKFERTKSSLETELKDLRDRYLEMSLKYAEVEAQREDLVMQLKTNTSGRRRFQEVV